MFCIYSRKCFLKILEYLQRSLAYFLEEIISALIESFSAGLYLVFNEPRDSLQLNGNWPYL